MSRLDLVSSLYAKKNTALTFDFNKLNLNNHPYFYIPQDAITALNKIARSSNMLKVKYKKIDDIMVPLGFKKLGSGTNRVVYRYLNDQSFVAKIALDSVGLSDNPNEYMNQQILQPFVAKMLAYSPCGTVGFSEKVIPIYNNFEFENIAEHVFKILVYYIGKYILEDVGTEFFMNWGVRPGFGPVLLDYPYIYELDGAKILCNKPIDINDPNTDVCGGEIDYDDGFNKLLCAKCGKRYFAKHLTKDKKNKLIIIRRDGNDMVVRVRLLLDDEVIIDTANEVKQTETIVQKQVPVAGVTVLPRLVSINKNDRPIGRGRFNYNLKEEVPVIISSVLKEVTDTTVGRAMIEGIPDILDPSKYTKEEFDKVSKIYHDLEGRPPIVVPQDFHKERLEMVEKINDEIKEISTAKGAVFNDNINISVIMDTTNTLSDSPLNEKEVEKMTDENSVSIEELENLSVGLSDICDLDKLELSEQTKYGILLFLDSSASNYNWGRTLNDIEELFSLRKFLTSNLNEYLQNTLNIKMENENIQCIVREYVSKAFSDLTDSVNTKAENY